MISRLPTREKAECDWLSVPQAIHSLITSLSPQPRFRSVQSDGPSLTFSWLLSQLNEQQLSQKKASPAQLSPAQPSPCPSPACLPVGGTRPSLDRLALIHHTLKKWRGSCTSHRPPSTHNQSFRPHLLASFAWLLSDPDTACLCASDLYFLGSSA